MEPVKELLDVFWHARHVAFKSIGKQSLSAQTQTAQSLKEKEDKSWVEACWSLRSNKRWSMKVSWRIHRPYGWRTSCSNSTCRHFSKAWCDIWRNIAFSYLLLMYFLHDSGSGVVLACQMNCGQRKKVGNHTAFNSGSPPKAKCKLPAVVQWLCNIRHLIFLCSC